VPFSDFLNFCNASTTPCKLDKTRTPLGALSSAIAPLPPAHSSISLGTRPRSSFSIGAIFRFGKEALKDKPAMSAP
jgi:hypothetical protein